MRIRTIKPEFFEDERIAAMPPHDRLLFIGLWCMADKNGVIEDRPAWIRARVFPYEIGETTDVSQMLPRLVSGGHLVKYEVEGRPLLWIRNFTKHQRITGKEAEGCGRFPMPPNDLQKVKHPGNTRETPEKHPGAQEQGTGNREQGTGNGQVVPAVAELPKKPEPRGRFAPPTAEELDLESARIGLPPSEALKFQAFFESNGWKVGRNPMKSWKAALVTWRTRWEERRVPNGHRTLAGQTPAEMDADSALWVERQQNEKDAF